VLFSLSLLGYLIYVMWLGWCLISLSTSDGIREMEP